MKFLKAALFLCLCASTTAIHATSLDPLTDGYSLSVGNTVLTDANASYNPTRGVLMFSDGTETYTFAEVIAAPLVNALSVTRSCITVNLSGCSSEVVSISNANVLNGTLQASALVGVTLQASATAGAGKLLFAQTTAALGAESAVTGFNPSATSVTPEPSSLALLGTGLVGVYGVARRRFQKTDVL